MKRSPLAWWEWVEVAGGAGLVALLPPLLLDVRVPAAVVGVTLHTICDFTFQSEETAARKGECGRHLAIHALVAGGLPGVITGLLAGGAPGAIIGFLIGTLSHYAIDGSHRFGIRGAIGIVLDQAAHVAVILFLAVALPLSGGAPPRGIDTHGPTPLAPLNEELGGMVARAGTLQTAVPVAHRGGGGASLLSTSVVDSRYDWRSSLAWDAQASWMEVRRVSAGSPPDAVMSGNRGRSIVAPHALPMGRLGGAPAPGLWVGHRERHNLDQEEVRCDDI